MRKILLFAIITFCAVSAYSQKFYLIPTLHGLHKTNSHYNYDTLRSIIEKIRPDVIAVEIRPEDINSDSGYLSKNYPFEMRMMHYWFPSAIIEGFDWLGDDIKGRLIPSNYWKESSAIKKYERSLDEDSTVSEKRSLCDTFQKERLQLLKTLSLNELLESKDAFLTKQFYSCLENALQGTVHERVLRFYDRRNKMILQNIKKLKRKYKNKVIVVLTGDDHFVYLRDKLKNKNLF